MLLNSLLLTSAVLVATILMVLRLGRDIVRLIGLLARAVEKIDQGIPHVRLGADLGGEFTLRGEGITRMAVQLRGLYETLQNRIQEATAKLSWQAVTIP